MREQRDGSSAVSSADIDGADQEYSADSTQLMTFLQRASTVCERLLEEDDLRKGGGVRHVDRSSTHGSFFSDEKQWVDHCRASSGAHELIRTRPATFVKFSGLQPHLLVSTHPL